MDSFIRQYFSWKEALRLLIQKSEYCIVRDGRKIYRKVQKGKEEKKSRGSIINLKSINVLPGNDPWGRILWVERQNLLSDTGVHTGVLFI